MTDESARQTVLFSDLFDKPAVAIFDEPHSSSDGGAILLRAIDRQLGLTDALATAVTDPRDPAKVRHGLRDLMAQRVYGIACGYPDANDADALARPRRGRSACPRLEDWRAQSGTIEAFAATAVRCACWPGGTLRTASRGSRETEGPAATVTP